MPISSVVAGLHRDLSRGTMTTRRLYARARGVARFRHVVRRRAAASRLADPEAPRIPDDDGFLVVRPWSRPGIEPLVRRARELRRATDTAPLWEESEGRNLLRVHLEPRLAHEPEWIASAVDPVMLSTVARYLGAVPLLGAVQLWISPYATHTPDGRPLEHRYHCDWADERQVRALVFVEDVTDDHGPLTVLPARTSQSLRLSRRYTFGEAECTVRDDEIVAHAGSASERALSGPAGTLAFADTSRCFHQGSRLRRAGLERVMVMFQFLNVTAFKLPARFAHRSPYASLAKPEHTELQRLALGAR